MTAARLGRRKDAVDALLLDTPKNAFLANGHNAQGTRKDLPLYLPGNGSLLIAAAMNGRNAYPLPARIWAWSWMEMHLSGVC